MALIIPVQMRTMSTCFAALPRIWNPDLETYNYNNFPVLSGAIF